MKEMGFPHVAIILKPTTYPIVRSYVQPLQFFSEAGEYVPPLRIYSLQRKLFIVMWRCFEMLFRESQN